MVWNQVRCESIVSDSTVDHELAEDSLVAHLSVQGVWSPQAEVLFDVCVVETEVQSYLTHTPKSVLFGAEIEKKQKYSAARLASQAHFTLLCCSVDSVKHPPLLEDFQVALLLDEIEATMMLSHG